MNDGNVAQIRNDLDNNRTVNFTYDELDRVKTASTQGSTGQWCWGQSFTYDRYANLLSATVTKCSAPSPQLSVDSNNHITNTGFRYDAAGNLTSDGSLTYSYDAENRIKANNGVNYVYDGLRNRVKNARLYWFSGGQVLAETDLTGTLLREFVYFGSTRIARRDASGSVFYFFSDHLRSVRRMTDATGNVQQDLDYYPFGGEVVTSSANAYKFTGKERDGALDYSVFRSYTAQYARFTSPDPVHGGPANPQSWNRYPYALNRPTAFMDPLGLEPCPPNTVCTTVDVVATPIPAETIFSNGYGAVLLVSYVPYSYCWLTGKCGGYTGSPFFTGGSQSTIRAGTLDQLNDYCSARGRAKFIADWVPGSSGLVRNLWGSPTGEALGFYQLSTADLNRITEENSGGQTVAMHAACEWLKTAAGSTAFLSWFRSSTGIPKTLASKWLGRAAWFLVAVDAGLGYYKEGQEILNCQAGN